MAELHLGARKLDAMGKDLGETTIQREALEQEVTRKVLILRATVYQELRRDADQAGRKSVAGQDVRDALVAERMDEDLAAKVAELAGLKARKEALQEYRRATSDAISARQTVLNGLKDEESAGTTQPSTPRVPIDPATGEVEDADVPF